MSTSRLPRSIAVTALVLGPVSLIGVTLAQWMLQRTNQGAGPLDLASGHPSQWSVIAAASVLGPVVWLAGLPAVSALPTDRGRRLTLVGALLTGAGLAAGIGHLALVFGTFSTLAAAGLSPQEAAQVAQAADVDWLGNALLVTFLVGYAVGPLLLALGLRKARLVPVWAPLAAVLTAAATLFGGPLAGIVQVLALIALWGAVVRAVIRVHPDRPASALAPTPSSAADLGA